MVKKKFQLCYAVEQTEAYASTIELDVEDTVNVVKVALTGAATLSMSANSKAVVGNKIALVVSSDATGRDLTFGTGIKAPVLAGVANKTKVQELIYDGGQWVACSAPVQID